MLEIIILGTGCSKKTKPEQMIFNIFEVNSIDADIQNIKEFKEYGKYALVMTSGLVVKGKVFLQSKILVKSTHERWQRDAKNNKWFKKTLIK